MEARPPRRRIVRSLSAFRKGQAVRVDGGAAGDYFGTVIKTHNHMTKTVSAYTDETDTRPGVTVRVTFWDGVEHNGPDDSAFAPFEIIAWDSETTAWDGENPYEEN